MPPFIIPYSAKFSRGLIFADFVGLEFYTKIKSTKSVL